MREQETLDDVADIMRFLKQRRMGYMRRERRKRRLNSIWRILTFTTGDTDDRL